MRFDGDEVRHGSTGATGTPGVQGKKKGMGDETGIPCQASDSKGAGAVHDGCRGVQAHSQHGASAGAGHDVGGPWVGRGCGDE